MIGDYIDTARVIITYKNGDVVRRTMTKAQVASLIEDRQSGLLPEVANVEIEM